MTRQPLNKHAEIVDDICLNTQELDEALKEVEKRLKRIELEERRRKLEDFLAFEGFRSGQRYVYQNRRDYDDDTCYYHIGGFRFFAMHHEQHVWFGQEIVDVHWDDRVPYGADEWDFTKPLQPPIHDNQAPDE